MRVKVEVTERDIKLGRKNVTSCSHCAVARAMKRARLKGVSVGVEYGSFQAAGRCINVFFPKKIVSLITNLCHGRPAKPVSFTVNVPAA